MKSQLIKITKFTAFIGIIFLGACSGEGPQNAEDATPEKMETESEINDETADLSFENDMTGKAFRHYIQIEESLFDSDFDAAKEAANNLSETLTAESETLKTMASDMADSENIEDLRKHFFSFSKEAEAFFSEALVEGTIYKQFCPMAFDNEGAFWIADVKEINNPYFGERMPHCGKTVEIISK